MLNGGDDDHRFREDARLDDELETEADELMYASQTAASRRRQWWRDAIVNCLFIASWYIDISLWFRPQQPGSHLALVRFAFATLLSMYNKWMFTPAYFNFPFPLFVTTMHMAMQFILAASIRRIWPHIFNPPGRPTGQEYIRKCMPCGVTTGLDIGLSNLSLRTITLSLYTMCKSSSLIFVLTFAFLFRLEKFSWRLVGVILLITSGVLLMVLSTDVSASVPAAPPTPPDDDSGKLLLVRSIFAATVRSVPRGLPEHLKTPMAVGVLLVMSASAFGGLRWALTQLLLTGHGHGAPAQRQKSGVERRTMGLNNPAATIFWLSPTMFVTLSMVAMWVEGPFPKALTESGFFDTFGGSIKTIGYILLPGAVAFCMVMSEYYIIQRTGVVPMSIAGIFKEVTTILLSTWFFGDSITLINWIGLIITFCGIIIFTHHKYEKSVNARDQDDMSASGLVTQEIALPAYTAVASEDDISRPSRGEYADDMDEDEDDDEPLMASSARLPDDGALKPNERTSNLIFDAGRDDEAAVRGTRASADLTLNDINPPQVANLFNPLTPRDYPSPAISPGRKTPGKRKDLKVRFKDDEENDAQGDQWANEGSSTSKSLDFR
ncbi:Triose-phosphate Transporter [Tulasnella sp. 427]|nr:Triose-phosphate Transporter [Tulasnella sp. 427]